MSGKKIKYDHTKDKINKNYIGMGASMAAAQVKRDKFIEKYKTNKNIPIRLEIHGIIAKALQDGKTTEEILELLSDERYDKYREYFSIWISDKERKMNDPRNKGKERLY